MKRLALILLMVFISFNAFALSEEEANNAISAYNSLQQQLNQAAATTNNKRSTTSVILEGWVASGSKGLVFASQDFIAGPITKDVVASLAVPIYVEDTFGLYSYEGYVAQVWYVNNLASLITLMTYSD